MRGAGAAFMYGRGAFTPDANDALRQLPYQPSQVCREKILHISIIIRYYYFKSEGLKMFSQCQSLKRACQ